MKPPKRGKLKGPGQRIFSVPDRTAAHKAAVTIKDLGATYEISLDTNSGILQGRAGVKPLIVSTTEGMRSVIERWAATSFELIGYRRPDFIFYTTVTTRYPKCESCKGDGTIDGRKPWAYCETCGGAGYLLPAFAA